MMISELVIIPAWVFYAVIMATSLLSVGVSWCVLYLVKRKAKALDAVQLSKDKDRQRTPEAARVQGG